MLNLAVTLAFTLLGVALLLTGWRLWYGPTTPDRILALDTLYLNAVALLVLTGIRFASALYFEAALFIALLGFISTVALCRFVQRGQLFE
ncbi:MAG: K+/H+ antiporter subunit F [Candidatus Contendobacter sp.]|jgi:multicomponent K+:H+ antiporter subunit F|nr:K+/H+ antiporter subunit F [Gammaproteobacteria bacterium]MCC8993150.1 K+/H+ antiporter subunit F [Candidatus Contendobacter sp.]